MNIDMETHQRLLDADNGTDQLGEEIVLAVAAMWTGNYDRNTAANMLIAIAGKVRDGARRLN